MADDFNLETVTGEISKRSNNFDSEIRIKSEEDGNFKQEVLYFNSSTHNPIGEKNANGGVQPVDATEIDLSNFVQTHFDDNSLLAVKYKLDEHGKEMKFWKCAVCGKEYNQQYVWARHMQAHANDRKYVCSQCGKAFRQMSTLVQHSTTHSKLRPHMCNICQKTFNRISTLISHQKTHTGKKPHCCHLCNKAFHQKGNLRNHIFTHTNERPYKCDVCQKGFNQMSNLMCHKMKAHQRADKLKHACSTCGKVFQKRITLQNHEQYAHGDVHQAQVACSVTSDVTSMQHTNHEQAANEMRTPSVKYTNGVMIPKITTIAMRQAQTMGIVPFALLRPLDGVPVLVRVFPSGDNQLLVPATKDDLKKHTTLIPRNLDTDGDITLHKESKVFVRIPVVAIVIQKIINGQIRMEIIEAGPDAEERQSQKNNYMEYGESKNGAYCAMEEYDDCNEMAHRRDPNMYEAAASLIDLRMRTSQPIDVDETSVEMFSAPDEVDIDITNSVIDLEKDHEAFGIIAENGYNTAGREDSCNE